jgi:large subunit ribosomal protein L17
MQHHNKNRKFGLKTDQRRALVRSLSIALIENGKIKTTEAKAKEIRSIVEKMVTKAKTADLNARRQLISKIGPMATNLLITKIAPEFKERKGGYTRITKLMSRRTDAAKMALVEFVK